MEPHDVEYLEELILDLTAQACGTFNQDTLTISYDHGYLSTYREAIEYLVARGLVDVKQLVRPL